MRSIPSVTVVLLGRYPNGVYFHVGTFDDVATARAFAVRIFGAGNQCQIDVVVRGTRKGAR